MSFWLFVALGSVEKPPSFSLASQCLILYSAVLGSVLSLCPVRHSLMDTSCGSRLGQSLDPPALLGAPVGFMLVPEAAALAGERCAFIISVQ